MSAWEPTSRPADEAGATTRLRSVRPAEHDAARRRSIRMPSGVEASDVLSALLDNSSAAGESVSAHLWIADESTGTLRLVHAEGSSRPDPTPIACGATVLGAALESGLAEIQRIQRIATPAGISLIWRYALPLSAGETRGVAAVDFRGADRPDLDALTPVAGAMRSALAGALALHVGRTQSAVARALEESSRDLARMLDPEDVVSTALTRAIELTGAQTGSVMLLDEPGNAMHIVASHGLPAEVVSDASVEPGEGIAGWVLASGQPLLVEDIDERAPTGRRHGIRSAICVPVADEEGVLGVLNVGTRSLHAQFSRSTLEALESLGRSTAVALRNARAVSVARSLYFDSLKALAIAMESKDPYARGATDEVLGWAMAIAQEMAVPNGDLDALRVAAMMHDIGMSAAGDVVAVGGRPLSTVEWGMLKMHPVIAAEILDQAPALKDAVPIVLHHHEHFDGGGYLGGLAGENIPLGARILSVADAYVAMVSERPYRPAMTQAEAIAELSAQSGSQFDPRVVEALVRMLGRDEVSAPDHGSAI